MRVAAHITLFGAAQAAKTGDHLAIQIGGSARGYQRDLPDVGAPVDPKSA